jgi:formamidopyrimidine-DNA glycosylase
MPELPDLQVFSKNLNKKLKGKKLEKIQVTAGGRIKTSAAAFNKAVAGSRLKKVYRQGKQLRFLFDNDVVLGMHLMLHGKLYWFDKKNTEKYTIATLTFDGGTGLALTDFQKMAQLTLNPQETDAVDALSKQLTPAVLKKIFSGSRKQVKELLMDQKIISGIGNAYADEILWKAGIAPASISEKIPAAKITALANAIKKVLMDAEKHILKTTPDSIAGELRDFMLIHNAKKTKSPGGATIKHSSTRGRKTYYTDEQQLYK